jgi:hypothetical protein
MAFTASPGFETPARLKAGLAGAAVFDELLLRPPFLK